MTSMLGIAAIAEYFPATVVSSEEVARRHGFELGFLRDKLGIASRHVAAEHETTSQLATEAVRSLLQQCRLVASQIEALIVVTQTPDYMLPHVSALVHENLGLGERVAAFDVSLGCSGYIYGLGLALPFMEAHGFNTGVLVTAETYSKLISPDDRATAPLFGDGATATLISRQPLYTLGRTTFGTDGKRHSALIARGSGLRPETREPLFMDGREIFNFMMSKVPEDIEICLSFNKLTREEIDLWVFHQASAYMLTSLANKVGIPRDRLAIEMADVGNTTASSIPIVLKRSVLSQRRGLGKIFVSGFGVGLSWASTVLTSTEEERDE